MAKVNRRAARNDNNQKSLVRDLRRIPGVSVETGHDDILVGYKGQTFWFEVKDPERLKKDGTLKESSTQPSQKKLLNEWRGHYSIVWSLDMILDEIGIN